MPDAGVLVGKYNYNNDPVCLDIMGQDVYDRVSRGEAVSFPNFPAPIQSVLERGDVDEKPYEAATMDLFFRPVWDGSAFVCTILFYTVKNMYEGHADIGRAKAYIRERWLAKFDLDTVAAVAGSLSSRQFRRVFEAAAGRTPHAYHQKVKLEKIQEKLLDGSLTVAEAFTACGTDSHGAYFRLFKEKTGVTPSEYRKENLNK